MKRAGAWLAVLGILAGLSAPASAAAPSPEQRSKDIAQEVKRLRAELGEAADEETELLAELEVSRKTRQDLDAKVDRYRIQLAAYAHAVATVVDEPITRAVLLFLAPDQAIARDVDVTTVDVAALATTLW